jgi:hypothetical protein
MDRRTFALLAAGMGLSTTRCAPGDAPVEPVEDGDVPRPARSYETAMDRAFGVVDGLIERAEGCPAACAGKS